MGSRAGLDAIEAIIDASGIAGQVEAVLPAGVRHRQLTARTLLTGMMLAVDDHRPAHLTQARAALTSLPEADQARLGVTEDWHGRCHQLTYRQTEHTFGLIAKALSKNIPDGAPSDDLQSACDAPLEASIPGQHKDTASPHAPASLAADWTDVESWSRPPRHGSTECADPEARWGHRNSNLPGPKGEMFFGWYLSILTMVREEDGPAVPELTRRMTVCSCHLDPVRALAAVLLAMAASGTELGDIIDDSGYAHRDAGAWALPLRQAGAQLVQDLHPADRGPKGTCQGAIIANGNLYCPSTPKPLLELGPPPPGATPDTTSSHDQQTAELARYKLGRHTADDADGYHRARCPAAAGKTRCPLRPESMTLPRDRPEILSPPRTRPPAAPSRPSPSARTWRPKPARNMTTHPWPGGGPTPGAPAPNGSTPPSRTPPPPTSPAAGASSSASPRSPSGSPAPWPSATSAPSPPGRPAKTTTPAAPPPACPHAPASAGAPASPTSPPRRHNHHQQSRTTATQPTSTITARPIQRCPQPATNGNPRDPSPSP